MNYGSYRYHTLSDAQAVGLSWVFFYGLVVLMAWYSFAMFVRLSAVRNFAIKRTDKAIK